LKKGQIDDSIKQFESIIDDKIVTDCLFFYESYFDVLLSKVKLENIDKTLFELKIFEKTDLIKNAMFNALIKKDFKTQGLRIFKTINPKNLKDNDNINNYSWGAYKLGEYKEGLYAIEKLSDKSKWDIYIKDTYASLLSSINEDKKAIEIFREISIQAKNKKELNIDEIKKLYYRNNLKEEFEKNIQKL
jgi:hypothetical protein